MARGDRYDGPELGKMRPSAPTDRAVTGPLARPTARGILIVVREGWGTESLFNYLVDQYADEPGVRVIRDARHADRRVRQEPVTQERRVGERRRQPPKTWEIGFLVAIPGCEERAPHDSINAR